MIREDGVRGAGVSLVRSQARRDGGMHPTPLRVHKMVDILKDGISSTAFPIYWAARVMGKALGGFTRAPVHGIMRV